MHRLSDAATTTLPIVFSLGARSRQRHDLDVMNVDSLLSALGNERVGQDADSRDLDIDDVT